MSGVLMQLHLAYRLLILFFTTPVLRFIVSVLHHAVVLFSGLRLLVFR